MRTLTKIFSQMAVPTMAHQLLALLCGLICLNSSSSFVIFRKNSKLVKNLVRFAAEPSDTSNDIDLSWHSSLSRELNAVTAVEECLGDLLSQMKDQSPPLVCFIFMSLHHAPRFRDIVNDVEKKLADACADSVQTIAMVGGGVIGGNEEVDEASVPALSLLAGGCHDEKDLEITWYNELQKPPPRKGSLEWQGLNGVLVLGDPWSPLENILEALNKVPVAGGISLPMGFSLQWPVTAKRSHKVRQLSCDCGIPWDCTS